MVGDGRLRNFEVMCDISCRCAAFTQNLKNLSPVFIGNCLIRATHWFPLPSKRSTIFILTNFLRRIVKFPKILSDFENAETSSSIVLL